MITNAKTILLLSIIFLLPGPVFSQRENVLVPVVKLDHCRETFLDADSLPYKVLWLTNGKQDSVKYVTLAGKYINATFLTMETPRYPGGFDSLKSFFRREFKRPRRIEANGVAMILLYFFDEQFDVRVVRRIGYTNQRYDYDKEMMRVLLRTKDKWDLSHLPYRDEPFIFLYTVDIP